MARIYSTELQKSLHVVAAGTAETTAQDGVLAAYQHGGRKRNSYGVASVNNAAIDDIIVLAWLPKGAVILGGRIDHPAMGSNTLFSVGTLAAGSVTADTDDDRFVAAATAASAVSKVFPVAAQVGNVPFTVTDPKGAYLTVTLTNANTTASALLVKGYVDWVLD